MKKITTKVSVIIISIVLAFVLAACGGTSERSPSKAKDHDANATKNDVLATILCASDYQGEINWDAPRDTLKSIIDVAQDDGKNIDQVIICGDYTNDRDLHDYQLSPEKSIDEIKQVVEEGCPGLTSDNIIFEQGNHDHMTDSFAESGLHEYNDYLVYVVNAESDFPWKQGKVSGSLDKVKNTATEMKTCFDELIEKGETRPIIIACHVPLHFTGRTSSLHTTGDNLYASILFDVINESAKSLNIIFLFGHNHTKGWDCYLGQSCVFKAPGDSILIPEYSENDLTSNTYTVETLNFAYLNAGYIGHCMNCSPDEIAAGTVDQYKAADNTLTATVFEIYKDKVLITRYSKDGIHQLGSAGCANPYADDSSMISSEYYSKQVDGPQEIKRK